MTIPSLRVVRIALYAALKRALFPLKSFGPAKRFEASHRPYPAFNVLMILLNEIIAVFALPNGDGFFFGFIGGVRPTFIKGHDLGLSMVANRLAKEAQRGCGIPSRQSALPYRPTGTTISTVL